MTDNMPTPAVAQAAFHTLDELRRAHVEMIQRTRSQRQDRGRGASAERVEIQAFVSHIVSTGALLQDQTQRRAAQDVLDYWSARLMTLTPETTAVLPVIEAYRPPDDAPVTAPAPSGDIQAAPAAAPEPVASPSINERARSESLERVRLSALARQWRNSNRKDGYCLTGRALSEAVRFGGADPELGEFIAASQTYQFRMRVRAISVLASLAILIVAGGIFWWIQDKDAQIEIAKKQSEITAKEAEYQKAEAAQANRELEKIRQGLTTIGDLKAQLEAATDVLRREVEAGRIKVEDVPQDLRPLVQPPDSKAYAEATRQATMQSQAPPDNPALSGYQPEFLGIRLAIPTLSPGLKRTAFNDGRPLDFANYSVVFDAERKVANVTASNVDRRNLLVLPRQPDIFVADPRVPAASQLSQAIFARGDVVPARLVTKQEVTWGPYFAGDSTVIERRASGNVNVFTNVAIQLDSFNRGVWSELERWILTEHNRNASRIVIFSGPVLRDDDPVVQDESGTPVRMPRAFWKVAASTRMRDGKAEMVVDAFLIDQAARTDRKGEASPFIDELYRRPLADIERETGLTFDPRLRAETSSQSATPGAVQGLAGSIRQIDSTTSQVRLRTVQRLVSALRDNGVPEQEQKEIMTAIEELTRSSYQQLTQTGRYNLAFVLSEVPAASWARPDWTDLTTSMKKLSDEIEKSPLIAKEAPDASIRRFIDKWQRRMAGR